MADDVVPPAEPKKGGFWGAFNDWFAGMPPSVRHMLGGVVTAVVTILLTWVAVKLGVPVPVVPAVDVTQVAAPEADPPAVTYGWYNEPETVAAARGMVPTVFQATPAGGVEDLPPNVFQWQIHERVTGKKTPEKDQGNAGSCVGQGGTTAAERSVVCAIANGQPYEFTEFAEEAVYAVSRVDIGKGQLRGQDGSVGGWMARTQTEYGNLPAKKYPDGDFTNYDARRAQVLGDRGVSAVLKEEMAKHKAGSAALLRTTLDLRKALANGHGAFVCTVRGYSQQRDANGVCRQQGRWGHCMACDGYATVSGRLQYHLDNSWDHVYHRGPVGPGDPTGTGFYVTEAEMGAILSEGDSWAVSAVPGFPKQNKVLDWFVRADQPRRPFADPFVLALAP